MQKTGGGSMRTETGRAGSAFTLIELLVVIAVISILLLLLVPSIGGVQGDAESTGCQNNLRQMHTAFTLHHDDHNHEFKLNRGYWMNKYANNARPIQLLPYIAEWTASAYRMETLDKAPTFATCPTAAACGPFYSKISYTYAPNFRAVWSNFDTKIADVPNMVSVRTPSEMLCFADGLATPTLVSGARWMSDHSSNYRLVVRLTVNGVTTPFVHEDKANMVFMDGHVETLTPLDYENRTEDYPTNYGPFWMGKR